MEDKINSPIFVTGVERSGSSIVAKIMKDCGGFSGKITDMYENVLIKELIDKYYDVTGADKRGQDPLPDINKLVILTNWKQKIEDILKEENYQGDCYWVLKGSRLCQTWPIWHYAFPDARWIIVRRRTGDIIESCLKTGYMTAYKDREGWLEWIHKHEKLFVKMIETGLNCKQVWPERMAIGNYEQMKETVEWVGLKWNEDVVDMVDSLLYKSKQRKE